MIGEIYGDAATFQTMLSGQPDMVTNQYLMQQYQASLNSYAPVAQQFFQQQQNTPYAGIDFNEVNRLSKALNHQQSNGWIDDTIQPLATIEQFQHASPAMMRWVMAEPTLRARYHEQRLAGYDEYYVDNAPGLRGDQHIDYQLAMQGVVHEDSQGNWVAHEWFNDHHAHQTEALDIVDQSNIQIAWANVRAHMEHGFDDPTSRFNAAL